LDAAVGAFFDIRTGDFLMHEGFREKLLLLFLKTCASEKNLEFPVEALVSGSLVKEIH